MLAKLIKDSEERDKSISQLLKNRETTLRNHDASIHNLETQVGQIAKLISKRQQGSLPRNTEVNPREHVNVVVLESEEEKQDGIQDVEVRPKPIKATCKEEGQ